MSSWKWSSVGAHHSAGLPGGGGGSYTEGKMAVGRTRVLQVSLDTSSRAGWYFGSAGVRKELWWDGDGAVHPV